jgi:predicted DNA binding CopG/RHH family protein
MKRIKLTREEKAIEDSLLKGEYVDVSREELNEIQRSLDARKKNAVLNMRINWGDLQALKDKARKAGIKYQSYISEILHRAAMAHKG